MNRIHRLRPLVLLLAGFAVLSIAESLQAKGKGPTNQRFEGSIYVPLPLPFPGYPGQFEISPWTHTVSPLGRVSGYFTVDTPSGTITIRRGRIFLQNRKGDSVSLTYEVAWPSPGDPNFYGTFTIVGGTGKFAGATGGGDFRHQQWMQPPQGPPPYIPAWFDGWIKY